MTKLTIALIVLFPALAGAQQFTIDAREQAPAPERGYIKTGTTTSPSGHTIEPTSRYLLRDGKPWLPVMGEFHFARTPANEWEQEIEKMQAGGVQIVATYIFWIHHEEIEGQFDWSGQRDLRKFVELCAKHGMLVYARIGPWSHGEARNGGFPDWLVKRVGDKLRSNDSIYLGYVDRFYGEIAKQLRGLYWKDGGPIVGVQLENEYNGTGPGRGEAHILALKQLAVNHGMDAPLYSVTGWDNAVLPPAEVIPVFGGYPDWPWDQSIEMLPANEVYAFRFANRWAGDDKPAAVSQAALARYPFLGAEYAGGIEDTYHRRPVMEANDIAAMLPVQLGSGVNLYGYYMFHGGTNPQGKLTTLMESQRTGYPTDLPVKSYDFQAPLSEFGEVRQSFRKIKLVHYFLNEFGDRLAPMVVRAPSIVPKNPLDTTELRVSARTSGERGFIFGSNYIRNYKMPVRRNVQIVMQLPNETVRVPAKPIDIPSGAYFIWPVNLDMGGVTLKYSTAQLITRTDSAYYFMAIPGIAPEFAFANDSVVRNPKSEFTASGKRIVLLTAAQAERLWRVGGRVVMTDGVVFSDEDVVHSITYGAPRRVSFTKIRNADSIPPVPTFNAVSWRKVEIALAPSDSAFEKAARWRIAAPADALVEIHYTGDVARLYAGDELLDDNFYNGLPWRVNLARFRDQLKGKSLELRVLPLRKDAPIYFDTAYRPHAFPPNGQIATVEAIRLIPQITGSQK